jgi:hypothetical protein
MHAVRIGEARLPYLFAGEHQHRRGVADESVEQRVQNRAVRHALWIRRGIAIEAVLANIEEERRKVLVAEGAQLADIGVEIESLDRLAQRGIEPGELCQDIALQLWHVSRGHAFGRPS